MSLGKLFRQAAIPAIRVKYGPFVERASRLFRASWKLALLLSNHLSHFIKENPDFFVIRFKRFVLSRALGWNCSSKPRAQTNSVKPGPSFWKFLWKPNFPSGIKGIKGLGKGLGRSQGYRWELLARGLAAQEKAFGG